MKLIGHPVFLIYYHNLTVIFYLSIQIKNIIDCNVFNTNITYIQYLFPVYLEVKYANVSKRGLTDFIIPVKTMKINHISYEMGNF